MPASAARVAANRANALKSTGPKTPEGKERSRGNALKHGLTGEGVVLPNEDVAEVERRMAAFQEELASSGEVERALVRRAAVMSVRLDRSVKQETAALSERVRRAEADFVVPEGISDEEAARLRAEAGRRATFDPSPEATLARKYEAATERGFFRALKELRLLRKDAKAAAPGIDFDAFQESLGSYLAETKEDEEFDKLYAKMDREAPFGPLRSTLPGNLATVGGSIDVPLNIGRRR